MGWISLRSIIEDWCGLFSALLSEGIDASPDSAGLDSGNDIWSVSNQASLNHRPSSLLILETRCCTVITVSSSFIEGTREWNLLFFSRLSSHLDLTCIMRLPSHPPTTLSCLFLLLPSLATAISLDCSDIRVDRTPFDLKPLDGPHNIYKVKEHPNSITNTTFTINICRPLTKNKDVPKDEDCPNGSRGKFPVQPAARLPSPCN